MKYVRYNKEYPSCADEKVFEYAQQLLIQDELKTSNELVINAVRCLIIRQELDYKNIRICYNNIEIQIDQYGNLEEWPPGFCDIYTDILMELI